MKNSINSIEKLIENVMTSGSIDAKTALKERLNVTDLFLGKDKDRLFNTSIESLSIEDLWVILNLRTEHILYKKRKDAALDELCKRFSIKKKK